MNGEEKKAQEAASALNDRLGAGMTVEEALQKLNIEDYANRIFSSNSHGELFHLYDYILIATVFKGLDLEWFRPWFEATVKAAEEQWQRPESVFQHIPKLLAESIANRA